MPDEVKTEVKPEVKRKVVALNATRLHRNAETGRTVMYATVPNEITIENMLELEFWAHISKNFQPGFRIEVEPDDGTYTAEFRVMSCGANWARVALRSVVHYEAPDEALDKAQEFSIEWAGRYHKFRVLRLSDKSVVKAEFDTKEDAAKWLAGYRKTVGV